MSGRTRIPSRALVVVVTALAALAALLLLLRSSLVPGAESARSDAGAATSESDGQAGTPSAPGAADAPPPVPEPDPRPVVEGSGPGPHTLPIGGTLILPASSLPKDAPVVFVLTLPEAARMKDGPHPIRVIAPDGRMLHASQGAEGEGVRLEIGADWLTPGRYVVEVKTADRSHFPLRRYAIEVR